MKLRLLTLILGSSILLYGLHSLAHNYNLYYDVAWFDLLMHALGGVIVASIFVYARRFVFKREVSGIWRALVFTLIVGILWEVLEANTGMTMTHDPAYPLDTIGDIFFDLFGAYLFMIKYRSVTNGR